MFGIGVHTWFGLSLVAQDVCGWEYRRERKLAVASVFLDRAGRAVSCVAAISSMQVLIHTATMYAVWDQIFQLASLAYQRGRIVFTHLTQICILNLFIFV